MAKFGYMKVPLAYMVAMVMCIITITAPWLQVPLAAAAQEFTTLSADAREFLDAHNQLRATARVANLVWNDSLAAVAKSFVEQQCASLAPCSSSNSAETAPAYSSGQNSWCIVATANPQPTSASQTVATSSRWVTSRFASYDDEEHHRHCHHEEEGDGEEGDGEEGDGGSSNGVARPAPGPLASASAPVPVGSGFARAPKRSVTDPPTPLVRSGFGMPPSPDYDASGNTRTDASPTPGSGSGSGGSGIDASPTPGSGSGSGGGGGGGGSVGGSPTPAPLVVPGTGSSNDGEEGDGGDGEEEEHHHHCHREEDGEGDGEEGDGEGDGGNAAQYFAQMVDSNTVSTGCYSLQCSANGVAYAACDYFPALPEIPTPPPTTSTKVRGLNL